MDIRVTKTAVALTGGSYNLTHELGKNFVVIDYGNMSQEFLIASCCDTVSGYDLNDKLHGFKYEEGKDKVWLSWKCHSSIWEKTYFLVAYSDHIEYFYELRGYGQITDLHFFQGIWREGFEEDCYLTKHFNDKGFTPYGEYSTQSPVSFKNVFNPEPNSHNHQLFEHFERSLIGVNSDLDYCGGNFVANPGILCFVIGVGDAWLSLGISAPAGQYRFSEYQFDGGSSFGLTLSYWGATTVTDCFRTPSVLIFPAEKPVRALEKYVKSLDVGIDKPVRGACPPPIWWQRPIICGWGYQACLGDLFRLRGKRPPDTAVYDACTQTNYEQFVGMIDDLGLPWGTLIIDSRWFRTDAVHTVDKAKWPDMRGFVESLHDRDKRVLIWIGPWATGGFSSDELITFKAPADWRLRNRPGRFAKFGGIQDGAAIAPDVTLPAVREKLSAGLFDLLSSGATGMNLDGLKIDHVASTPALYGLQFPEGSAELVGIELLKVCYDCIYRGAKAAKPDSLIIGQSPNPYFRGCFDMLRLGDIYSKKSRSVLNEMHFRKDMALLADPTWLIDCDGWPLPSLEALTEYMLEQSGMGVPSYYYAKHLDTTGEEIPPEFFHSLRQLWHSYSQALG